jgi:large subunit ribosomal protein L6
MSRIGKLPVSIPAGVTVTVENNAVKVKGPKGELSHNLPGGITVDRADNVLNVTRASDETNHKSLHGLTRSLIANMVQGVTATRSSSRSRASVSRPK